MSAINALTGSAGANSVKGSRFNDLSSEEFIKIIFTELQNQDPFKPNDSGALLDQLNSIRSIESDIDMSKRLQSIVSQNQLSTAGGLIGKRVAGLNVESERVGGTVTRSDSSSTTAGLSRWTMLSSSIRRRPIRRQELQQHRLPQHRKSAFKQAISRFRPPRS